MSGNKKKLNFIDYFLGAVALIVCIAVLCLCFYSTKAGTLYIKTSGDPSQVVSRFYDAMLSGQLDAAYSYLADCSSLGLEKESTDEYGQLLKYALLASFDYKLIGDVKVDGRSASQDVSFTYLDLMSMTESASLYIDDILNDKVQNLPKDQVFDDNGDYLQSCLDDTYKEALGKSLGHAADYYTEITYTVTMSFDGENWYINTNDEMIKGFSGGR